MKQLICGSCLLLCAFAFLQAQSRSEGPQYTGDGQLLRPANYREWVFLSAGLGMTYGPAAASASAQNPLFDNVFVRPEAYRAFLQTGTWPDKTVFVLEIRQSLSEGSINQGGHFQSDVKAIEIEVKDESRFPNKWAFFSFEGNASSGKLFPRTASCYSCHATNAAVDNTFVQFYPTLISTAKAKGTFRVTPPSAATPH